MKHSMKYLGASALALCMAVPASAHDEGWYLRGNAGVGVHTDVELSEGMLSNVHGNGINSLADIAVSAGLGYEFDENWRLELDGDTLFTDMGSISQIPSTFAKLRTNSLMLNAIYDFDDFGKWEPYIGAGIGLVQAEGSFAAHDFATGNSPILQVNPACPGPRAGTNAFSCDVSDKDTGFGWQLLAGLGYKLTDNLTWDTHYAYRDFGTFDFDGQRTNVVTGAATPFNASLADAAAHTVLTGLRYRFGHSHAAKAPEPMPVVPAPRPEPTLYTCWDGSSVTNLAMCPAQPAPPPPPVQTYQCWDNTTVTDLASCPAQPAPQPTLFTCADGVTTTTDLSTCPVVQQTSFNICGPSSVKIFDVPAGTNFKQVPRLGTMPEFGDSHGLSATQFYEKLDRRYNSNATDKAYLNYLFKSMGYTNGWADAQPYMFSEEVLPVGTRGILGLGEQHHFEFKILPTSDRDRQAFRIQSANGAVVHFMKTCGNYFYACE